MSPLLLISIKLWGTKELIRISAYVYDHECECVCGECWENTNGLHCKDLVIISGSVQAI